MGRKMDSRLSRDKFYIITNGKETECNYFTLLKAKKSIYDVKVEFQNADPLGLVEYAKRYIGEANQIWVVFDIDYTYEDKKLIPSIQLADKIGIKYAFSNLAFEVWLISHFQKCDKQMDIKQHEKELTAYLDSKKAGLTYDKTSEEQLKKYFIPYYETAVENAKIVYQTRMSEHRKKYGDKSKPEIWKWNSSTNVYKLIEALKLTVK